MTHSAILAAAGLTPADLSGGTLAVRSPIDGAELALVRETDPAAMPAIIARAQTAFHAWREVPAPRRGELVRLLGEELRAAKTELGALVTLEVGKITSEGLGEVQEMIALTYGMITNIDDRIGMVMDTLRACGADSNTVVIFTSDHGDLMGDHGIVLKGPLHYQGLIRVPMIWRDPSGVKGQVAVREDLASSIDLAAAIIHRAGIAPPNGMQGKPLFTPGGEAIPTGRDAVLIEENQQRAYLGFERPVKVRTVVTATHRMSVFAEGAWGELYDLKSDPHEKVNLWDAPHDARACISHLKAHRLKREAKILKVMQQHPEGSMDDWVRQAYDDVPPRLWPVAMRSLMAHVERIRSLS